jgi:DNA adenine methylase
MGRAGGGDVDRQRLKPPFAYYGGKTTLAPVIADLLPKHEHYVEPFAGSLAVLLAKSRASWETVNDLDGDLTTFWRVLRDRPLELARLAMLTPHSRGEYATSTGDLAEMDDLERARLVWMRLSQSRSNSMKPTGWRCRQDPSMGTSMPHYIAAYAGRMEAAAARLKRVSIENRDALDVISDYGEHRGVCIYADPPYLGSTRAANYRIEMLDDDLHVRLAAALRGCKASVVLSGYASPLYEDLYSGWHRTELKAPTALSGKAAEPEVLWSNVPLGVQGLLDFGGAA